MARNTTRDPDEMTTPVENPAIAYVSSTKTGHILDAKTLIGSLRYDRHVRLRALVLDGIHAGRPRLVCPICRVPVLFSASKDKRVYFKHRSEDGNCPAVTRGPANGAALREMIYQGRQESPLHRETKHLLVESMSLDPDFTEVAQERRWTAGDASGFRRPDVSAVFRGSTRMAFEAQLTTTFLDVVVGRRAFYRAQGGLLVWILRHFDPGYRVMTVDDIVFSNNSNVLVVDNETASASKAAGRFMVRVHYRVAGQYGGSMWQAATVPFTSLAHDLEQQRVYLHDFEGDEKRLQADQEQAAREAHEAQRARLRSGVLAFLANTEALNDMAWDDWRRRLASAGVVVGGEAEYSWKIAAFINGLASGVQGAPVGFRYTKLVQVANYLFDHQPGAVRAFGALCKMHGHRETLLAAGKRGAWEQREAEADRRFNEGDASFRIPADYMALVLFLFPELRRPDTPGA